MDIMNDELKNIIFTHKISNIFQKYHWLISSNSDKNFHFNYQGEIADYYLVVSYNYNYIQFDYTLDIEVPRDKINELQKLINLVNQKTKNGFFIYDLEVDKVKFHIIKQYFVKLKNKTIEDVIEENLNLTNYLFRNFTLATHNLMYAEKTDQNYIELMFMEVEGYA